MLIDHVGFGFFPQIIALRFIGRVSMPIFAFCIARGYDSARRHGTVNNYITRMVVFAAVSQIPYAIYFRAPTDGNIGVTWLFSLLILNNLEKEGKSALNYAAAALLAIGMQVIHMDYGLYAFLWVLVFYYTLIKDKKEQVPLLLAGCLAILAASRAYGSFFFEVQLYAFISVPVILIVRKFDTLRSTSLFGKYFFYVFYPAHLAVLAFIGDVIIA